MVSSAMKGREEDEALCKIDGSQKIFYEGTTPPNTRNHESCSSRWKKHLHPSLNKWHQALLAATSRHENGDNYYDEENEGNYDLAAFVYLRLYSYNGG
ncbi:hypothetical protein DVH24_024017 [Malus domestica]|uniref:Uncharacterized protein n=1 Tax=Malus domestica TaxID=3750 RepID=A0A498JKL2_MALDO|nr:hypothetical protein DVH24_024017 [Malus domestica]